MTSNRSCLFCSTTMCQRISIKDLYFSMNVGNLKYSSKKWSIKFFFPGDGENSRRLPFSQQGILGKIKQHFGSNVLFKCRKIQNTNNETIN